MSRLPIFSTSQLLTFFSLIPAAHREPNAFTLNPIPYTLYLISYTFGVNPSVFRSSQLLNFLTSHLLFFYPDRAPKAERRIPNPQYPILRLKPCAESRMPVPYFPAAKRPVGLISSIMTMIRILTPVASGGSK